MLKEFFKNEAGDTNIVSILVIMTVAIVLALLFKSYVADLLALIFQ